MRLKWKIRSECAEYSPYSHVEVEWIEDAPRTRTMLCYGRPRAIAFPFWMIYVRSTSYYRTPLRFLKSSGIRRYARFFRRPTALAHPDDTVFELSFPHMMAGGMVCFGDKAFRAIEGGVDPITMFWNTNCREGMSRLPPQPISMCDKPFSTVVSITGSMIHGAGIGMSLKRWRGLLVPEEVAP